MDFQALDQVNDSISKIQSHESSQRFYFQEHSAWRNGPLDQSPPRSILSFVVLATRHYTSRYPSLNLPMAYQLLNTLPEMGNIMPSARYFAESLIFWGTQQRGHMPCENQKTQGKKIQHSANIGFAECQAHKTRQTLDLPSAW